MTNPTQRQMPESYKIWTDDKGRVRIDGNLLYLEESIKETILHTHFGKKILTEHIDKVIEAAIRYLENAAHPENTQPKETDGE